ncbi:PTS transporter subunit IIC [Phytohalomonas tamaricis]|uniref:PTS transporter subunit IIC n=1 Tax=Phytohalomonas tamaricis TaxID=2081032 RepID=UPI000D0B951B|nr:PTS sugar transporter subunit IIC [Phytohalomonas tamaricis]
MMAFAARKNVTPSVRRYAITCLSHMALGLFASLIIGLIIKTIGAQMGIEFLVDMGGLAISLMGPAIGVGVAYALSAPPLVLFSALVCGAAGATLGGPAGAFVAALIGTEVGKLVSKETPVDILVTPLVTIFVGYAIAAGLGPLIHALLVGIGETIMWATDQQPVIMGIVVAIVMGLALTAPISSAAIAIMLELKGVAAGAATVGCAAQMVGFAASSYRENGISGLLAIGIGTSMLQIANIVKNPWILVPPTVAGALFAPLATTLFAMQNNPAGAGMGTSGLVGPIMTFQTMGFTLSAVLGVLLLQIVGPALVSLVLSEGMRKRGWIKPGDMAIHQG